MMSPGLRSWKSDEADAALEAGLHLAHVLLEAAQRLDGALPDDRALPQEAHLGVAGDGAVEHVAAGDGADAGHPEDLADLGVAGDDLFELGLEQAEHGVLDVLEHLVDDLVGADLDVLLVGHLAGLAIGAHVEADDGGVGRGGQLDVVLGDAADAAAHEGQLDLVALELAQALGERLERAGDVGLDDQVERGRLARPGSAGRCPRAGPRRSWRGRRGPGWPGAASARGSTATLEAVRSSGATTKRSPAWATSDRPSTWTGRRRTGFLDLLALVVDQGPDATPGGAGHERIADAQRALLHQHGGHGAPADVEVGLEHDADGPAVGVAPQVLELGDDLQVLEQVVDAECSARADTWTMTVSPDHSSGCRPCSASWVITRVGIGVLAVDLVDGHHDRAPRPPGRGRAPRGSGA